MERACGEAHRTVIYPPPVKNAHPTVAQLLPAFYEGPVSVENVTVANCTFEVLDRKTTVGDVLDKGPACCTVKGLVQRGNTVLCAGSRCN